jgi:heavy metal sensor kinase
MTKWWRPRSVRVRLTLWHLGALLAVLAAYAFGVYQFVERNLVADLDRQLEEDLDRAENSFTRTPDGTLVWQLADRDAADAAEEADDGPWVVVWELDGRLLYRTENAPAEMTAALSPAARRTEEFTSIARQSGKSPVRRLTAPQDVAGSAAIVRVARAETRIRHELAGLITVLLLGFPLAGVLAGVGGYLVARRALAPVDRMNSAARVITASRLSDRLPVENPQDELGRLAIAFNETFSRLEKAFDQLRRFTADASHEMRTPLTALRTVGEVGLREPRTEPEYREMVGSMLEEADRLNRLVESLLTLARADGGHVRLLRERVDLGSLARDVVDHLSVLAEDKSQTLGVDVEAPVSVDVDRVVLRQAVINLLDNAIKFTPVNGTIRVTVNRRLSEAVLEVRDSGPGIPAEQRALIFERFYRIDKGRSRDTGGVGLGLSIARWAAEVNEGRIEVDSPPEGGSVFRVVLAAAG